MTPTQTGLSRVAITEVVFCYRSLSEGQMKNINLLNITIRNCTFNGAFISGADNLRISKM